MSMRRIAPAFMGIPALALILSLIVPSVTLAGEPRTHDGFFLRLSGGGGYASTSINVAGIDVVELSGGAGDINLAVGGTVSPNLAVHGTIFGWSLSDPTVKVLALAFLLLVGVALVGDGLDMHIQRGYIYFAMAFSVLVEAMNLRAAHLRRRSSARS